MSEVTREGMLRFAQHLVSETLPIICQLSYLESRCSSYAVAMRWEDGFADAVCEWHAARVRESGALVVYPHRHDGTAGAVAQPAQPTRVSTGMGEQTREDMAKAWEAGLNTGIGYKTALDVIGDGAPEPTNPWSEEAV